MCCVDLALGYAVFVTQPDHPSLLVGLEGAPMFDQLVFNESDHRFHQVNIEYPLADLNRVIARACELP